jgi:hypothetical protein
MSDDLKRNMRARIAQCRRLAKHINDPRTTEALLQMADEGEADLKRLEAEEAGQHSMSPKMPPPVQG